MCLQYSAFKSILDGSLSRRKTSEKEGKIVSSEGSILCLRRTGTFIKTDSVMVPPEGIEPPSKP